MPTYDYKCTNCGIAFELFQPMSAEPVKECPECKGLVKRLIGTGAGTIFKGSGFYHTDYKNKSTGENKSASKDGDGKKEEAKTSKPDAKAESKPEPKKDSGSGKKAE